MNTVSKFGAAVCVVLAVIGLIYRSTAYWLLPVANGEPYGLGDILDLYFYVVLLLSICATVLFTVAVTVLSSRVPKKMALKIVVVSISSGIAYHVIHPLMPRLM